MGEKDTQRNRKKGKGDGEFSMIHCGLCDRNLKKGETWKEHSKSEEHQTNMLNPIKRMELMDKHIDGMAKSLGLEE